MRPVARHLAAAVLVAALCGGAATARAHGGAVWTAQDTTATSAAPDTASVSEVDAWQDGEDYDDDDDGESYQQRLLPAPEAVPLAVPQAALDRYRADPDYRYDTARGATGPSLLDRLWRWFSRTYLRPLFERAASRPGQSVLVGLGFAALIGLIVWLVRGGDFGVFRRRDAGEAMPHGDLVDVTRLSADDLDARLARARADGLWREATRWRFLVGLRRLGAAGVVRLDAHKTDGDYAREVRRAGGRDLTDAFAAAATAFAWVWYGRAVLDDDRLARLDATFDALDRALDATRDGGRTAAVPVAADASVGANDAASGDDAPRGGDR